MLRDGQACRGAPPDVPAVSVSGPILLAMPDGPARRALAVELGGCSGPVVLADDDPAGLLATIERARPRAVIVDPETLSGHPRALRGVVDAAATAPVLVVVESSDSSVLVSALTQGACGALVRDRPHDATGAIRAALDGQVAVPRTMVSTLVGALRSNERTNHGEGALAMLTERERLVLDMLAQGLSTRELARELVVAPVTVRSHIAAAVRKLGVPDRRSAVALVRELRVDAVSGPRR